MILPTKHLLEELQWVKRFIEKKTTIPILANVLFEANGNHLTLTGTDLEVGGITKVNGRGKGSWAVAVPVTKLIQYLGKVDEEEVTIEGLPTFWMNLTHGKDGRMRVGGMSKDSFPELPKFPASQCVISRLPLAVSRTAFAVSNEVSRFTLNGMLLEVEDGNGYLMATDGHRLSRAPLAVKGVTSLKVLIPKGTMVEAARFDAGCSFSMDPAHAFFDWGQRKIISRKLDGNFPDWRRVMVGDFPNHAMLPTKTLLKTLTRVAVCADERSRAVRLQVNDGSVTLFSFSSDNGEAQGEVAITTGVNSGPFEAGYNADYITEFLQHTDAQFTGFCWQSDQINAMTGKVSRKACEQAAQLVTGDGWQYTLMPLRLS